MTCDENPLDKPYRLLTPTFNILSFQEFTPIAPSNPPLLKLPHNRLIPNPLRKPHRPLLNTPHPTCPAHTLKVALPIPIPIHLKQHKLIDVFAIRLQHLPLMRALSEMTPDEKRHRVRCAAIGAELNRLCCQAVVGANGTESVGSERGL